ncbi:MAG TPA: hypothetical protein VF173_34605 [Thermoanaerobaculia bacterium]|nr:hypothetical protein [Thermoanaerobaculia bacterium]
MGNPFDPVYYSTVDEIYHCEWILACLARHELLKRSIRRLWPAGHPTRLVQVAGTAGKGSTCRFLEAGLALAGRSGAFSSPELFDFRERFSIGGTPVERGEVTRAWETRIRPLCIELALQGPEHVHYFHEVNILVALALFEEHGVEWAAVETAVGGRYDQTTALEVAATVLTNVGSDHEKELGHTPWQRALDKAGIARPGIPFFTGEKDPALRELIAAVCRSVGAPCHLQERAHVEALERLLAAAAPESFLSSAHQKWNAALCLEVLRALLPDLDPARAVESFETIQIPGRFWQVEEGLYADIAHNPDKVAAVAAEAERRFGDRGKIFVVGVTKDRPARAVLAPLVKLARVLIVTKAALDGQDPQKVKEEIDALGAGVLTLIVPKPAEAVQVARDLRHEQDVIVVTGDMDVIDEALNPDPYLRTINATVGWRGREEREAQATVQLKLP